MRLAKAVASAFLCAISVSALASNPFVPPAQSDLGVLKKLDQIERRVQDNTLRIEDAMMGRFARPDDQGGGAGKITGTVLPGGELVGRINGECLFKFQSGIIITAGPDDCESMLMFQSGVLGNQRLKIYFTPECPGFLGVPKADRITFSHEQAAQSMGYTLSPSCDKESVESSASSASSVVKKSRSGICYDANSPYYERTKSYSAFPTMSECLKSGGRRPSR